ncbi:MAG TPA: glycosyltransferase family 1 protein, partial [Acidimicrobiales bacterium]|nr:glycosyltransferase family 1 protein [Acidimicrobiales bacterium]
SGTKSAPVAEPDGAEPDGAEPDGAGTSEPLALTLDVSAVPADPVGAGQYTMHLASALAARADVDVTLIGRRGDRVRWPETAPGAPVVATAPQVRPLRLAWEQLALPGLLRRLDPSVHHGPHYTMPERSSVPMVVTVHDLSFFEDPQWHDRTKVVLFKRAIRVAARRAAAVVCPSRATAVELDRWCRVDATVFVAHHGVDAQRFAPEEPEPGADAAALGRIDARLGDGRPYLVFVGTLEPRKDVPSLIHAFDGIADRHPDALLVLAGGNGWGAGAVDQALAAVSADRRVVRTGYVADAVIPALLRSAVAAVYPARYEGFGLPALEALSCGTPLITTSGTAMEEVAGDAATLVTPGDRSELAEALDAALGRGAGAPGEHARRRRVGLEIAAAHTWERSADRHVEAYRYAHGAPRRSGRTRRSVVPPAKPVG